MTQLFDRDYSELLKCYLAIAAIAWLVLDYFCRRFLPKGTIIFKALLTSLCLLSFLGYSRALNPGEGSLLGGLRYTWVERIDSYDLIHYYLGPKYFSELSYFRLYPNVLTVDIQNGGPYFKPFKSRDYILFQDEKDYFWVRASRYLDDPSWQEESRILFSDSRWQEFTHDLLTLQRGASGGLSRESWNDMLWDHGFNGTPAWIGTVSWLCNLISVENVKLLCLTDALFVLVAFLCAWWALGSTSALFFLLFMFCSYSSRWPTISWSFGRYDYVSFLVIALSCLKKEKWILAGIFAGWSGSLRIFPFVWCLGPISNALFRSTWRKRMSIFLMGIVLSSAVLWGNAVAQFGTGSVEIYLRKMSSHTSIKNLSSMREGFALALAFDGNNSSKRINNERRKKIESQTPIRVGVAITLIALFLFAIRRLSPHETFAYGVVPFFLFFTASYYYYIVRATLVVMHSSDLAVPRNRFLLGFLFAMEALSNFLSIHYQAERVLQIGVLGWCLSSYIVILTLLLLLDERNRVQDG